MNNQEIILKQFLDKWGIDPIIRKRSNIQKIQNAVYEASINDVDLGYFFGDYPVGKFSPELRDVIYELHNSLVLEENEKNKEKKEIEVIKCTYLKRGLGTIKESYNCPEYNVDSCVACCLVRARIHTRCLKKTGRKGIVSPECWNLTIE